MSQIYLYFYFQEANIIFACLGPVNYMSLKFKNIHHSNTLISTLILLRTHKDIINSENMYQK